VCGAVLGSAPQIDGSDRLHGTPGEFWVRVCGSCGAGNTRPSAAPEDLSAYYPQDYGPYELPSGRLVRQLSRAIRSWQGWLALRTRPLAALAGMEPGRVVDVGCGRGDLAALLAGRGWRATGVEPSPEARAQAAGRGVDARGPTVAEAALEPGTYDAAIFRHSLEHLPDPLADLRLVRSALRDGGVVAITVPNFGCWQRRRFGGRWFHLDLPRHRVHYGGTALQRALEGAGLEVLELTSSTSTVGLPATIQYAVVGRCLFPAGLRLRVATGLSVLAYPLARLLDRVAGEGDLLHALARKPEPAPSS
jgi:SAM-dependent methyltransferase